MVRTRRRRIRDKVKKFQKKKKRLQAKLSEYGIEGFTVYRGYRRAIGGYGKSCLIFDHAAAGVADDDILTPAEFEQALGVVRCKRMLILHAEDNEVFDNFEEFRKYILIKKLSGIE